MDFKIILEVFYKQDVALYFVIIVIYIICTSIRAKIIVDR